MGRQLLSQDFRRIFHTISKYLAQNGPSPTEDIKMNVSPLLGCHAHTVERYLSMALELEMILRKDPLPDARPDFYLWYTPDQEAQYNDLIQHTEDMVLGFLKVRQACRLIEISVGLHRPRRFIKKILSRLILRNQIKLRRHIQPPKQRLHHSCQK